MKRFFILVLAIVSILACSLTNGASVGDISAAQFKPALITATPSPSPTAKISTSTPSPERCKVTASFLNLRACPGTSCAVLDVLKAGVLLTVSERGHWLKVETMSGAAGFVNSNYCKTIGE